MDGSFSQMKIVWPKRPKWVNKSVWCVLPWHMSRYFCIKGSLDYIEWYVTTGSGNYIIHPVMWCLNHVLHNMAGHIDKDILRFAGYPTITHYCAFVLMTDAIQMIIINTLRPRQNGWHFYDDIFKWIFLKENVWIQNTVWLKFVPKG